MLSRRHFLRTFSGLGVAGVSTVAYGFSEPELQLRVTRYRISPPQWPADFRLKIAVIADVHACDPWMSLERIQTIVEHTNALGADITVMLGDYVAGQRHVTRFIPADEWAAVLAGLEAPSGGEVLIDGAAVTSRLGALAFMPQRDALLPWRRTLDNVTIGLEVAVVKRADARARAAPLLERFGLGGFESAWPWQLSGGMRSRAAFLRTILLGKPGLLLDEPFAGVDPLSVLDIQRIIRELTSRGIGVLITDHNVRETLGVCGRAYIVNQGTVIAQGTAEEILANPQVREVYLGQSFRL